MTTAAPALVAAVAALLATWAGPCAAVRRGSAGRISPDARGFFYGTPLSSPRLTEVGSHFPKHWRDGGTSPEAEASQERPLADDSSSDDDVEYIAKLAGLEVFHDARLASTPVRIAGPPRPGVRPRWRKASNGDSFQDAKPASTTGPRVAEPPETLGGGDVFHDASASTPMRMAGPPKAAVRPVAEPPEALRESEVFHDARLASTPIRIAGPPRAALPNWRDGGMPEEGSAQDSRFYSSSDEGLGGAGVHLRSALGGNHDDELPDDDDDVQDSVSGGQNEAETEDAAEEPDPFPEVAVPMMSIDERVAYTEELMAKGKVLLDKMHDTCMPLDRVARLWREKCGGSGEKHEFMVTLTNTFSSFLEFATLPGSSKQRAEACGELMSVANVMSIQVKKKVPFDDSSVADPRHKEPRSASLTWLGKGVQKMQRMVAPKEARELLTGLPTFDTYCFPATAIADERFAMDAKRHRALERLLAIEKDLDLAAYFHSTGSDGHAGLCEKAVGQMWQTVEVVGAMEGPAHSQSRRGSLEPAA